MKTQLSEQHEKTFTSNNKDVHIAFIRKEGLTGKQFQMTKYL